MKTKFERIGIIVFWILFIYSILLADTKPLKAAICIISLMLVAFGHHLYELYNAKEIDKDNINF